MTESTGVGDGTDPEVRPGTLDLATKVGNWLQAEGYPLEFATAVAFREAGFHVIQGEYTEPTPTRPRREVDVVTHMTHRDEKVGVTRVEFVVECKWSEDKPWVFFCEDWGMTTAACAAQTIGSQLAELLLWKEAGSTRFELPGAR